MSVAFACAFNCLCVEFYSHGNLLWPNAWVWVGHSLCVVCSAFRHFQFVTLYAYAMFIRLSAHSDSECSYIWCSKPDLSIA